MTDQVLDILQLVLLALLYLFFARVLWAVWSEVRAPVPRSADGHAGNPGQSGQAVADGTPALGQPAPLAAGRQTSKPPRAKRGQTTAPARLVVLEPKDRRGTAFAIVEPVTIGRDPDNVVVISDDSFVSGHHARLWPAEGHVLLDDLGSKNGTYLNGSPIAKQRTVHIGDRVQIGYTVLEAQ